MWDADFFKSPLEGVCLALWRLSFLVPCCVPQIERHICAVNVNVKVPLQHAQHPPPHPTPPSLVSPGGEISISFHEVSSDCTWPAQSKGAVRIGLLGEKINLFFVALINQKTGKGQTLQISAPGIMIIVCRLVPAHSSARRMEYFFIRKILNW